MMELAKCPLRPQIADRADQRYPDRHVSGAKTRWSPLSLIGGILRHGLDCTVGPIAISSLHSLNVDKAFLGANAFSVEKGFTTPDINQAEVKKALIRCARRANRTVRQQ